MMERDDQNRGVVHAASSPGDAVSVQVMERCASAVKRGDGATKGDGRLMGMWWSGLFLLWPPTTRLREKEMRSGEMIIVMMVDGGSRGMRLREMKVIWIWIGGDE
ncbi:hypothetical protein Q3G72_018307 [Acer saccharum]|nr:hypothetical protein Q3G72_018307 [Acer saccharum]